VELCLDRQQIIDTVLYGLTSVPDSYVPDGHPLHDPAGQAPTRDIAAANALLEEAGWRDVDGIATTPRQAWGVPLVTNGTPFEVSLLTSQATQRVQVSTLIAASLAECGIQVSVENLDQSDLYMSGPDGPLFGRTFELAEFAMGTGGVEPPCEWFTSSEIPSQANLWVGTNLSGYNTPEFDAACSTARQSLPDETAYQQAFQQAQALFARDLPVIPLYWRMRIAAARPEVCGLALDTTASSGMWNIESLAVGADCTP
jgi:peptide/nickel transport system substrate-binding protein